MSLWEEFSVTEAHTLHLRFYLCNYSQCDKSSFAPKFCLKWLQKLKVCILVFFKAAPHFYCKISTHHPLLKNVVASISPGFSRQQSACTCVFATSALSINVTRLLISAIIVCVVFVQEFTSKQTEAIKTHAPSDHQWEVKVKAGEQQQQKKKGRQGQIQDGGGEERVGRLKVNRVKSSSSQNLDGPPQRRIRSCVLPQISSPFTTLLIPQQMPYSGFMRWIICHRSPASLPPHCSGVIKNKYPIKPIVAEPPACSVDSLHLPISSPLPCVARCLRGVVKPALQTGPLKSSKEGELNVGGFVQAYLVT